MLNFDCVMLDPGGIEIGDNVLFRSRVSIYTARHAFDAKERGVGACFAKKVTIGNNVLVCHTIKIRALISGKSGN